MPKPRPYQPLLFRVVHAVNGILAFGSLLTGFWLYNTWDYRFGRQYALHRLINTGLLGMLILSQVSARQFGGAKVLVQGEWNDVWYSLHLFAWASIVVLVALHVLLGLKVGGWPLLQSMVDRHVRAQDSPKQWPQRWKRWFQSLSR